MKQAFESHEPLKCIVPARFFFRKKLANLEGGPDRASCFLPAAHLSGRNELGAQVADGGCFIGSGVNGSLHGRCGKPVQELAPGPAADDMNAGDMEAG